jgi:hypothetical protein
MRVPGKLCISPPGFMGARRSSRWKRKYRMDQCWSANCALSSRMTEFLLHPHPILTTRRHNDTWFWALTLTDEARIIDWWAGFNSQLAVSQQELPSFWPFQIWSRFILQPAISSLPAGSVSARLPLFFDLFKSGLASSFNRQSRVSNCWFDVAPLAWFSYICLCVVRICITCLRHTYGSSQQPIAAPF